MLYFLGAANLQQLLVATLCWGACPLCQVMMASRQRSAASPMPVSIIEVSCRLFRDPSSCLRGRRFSTRQGSISEITCCTNAESYLANNLVLKIQIFSCSYTNHTPLNCCHCFKGESSTGASDEIALSHPGALASWQHARVCVQKLFAQLGEGIKPPRAGIFDHLEPHRRMRHDADGTFGSAFHSNECEFMLRDFSTCWSAFENFRLWYLRKDNPDAHRGPFLFCSHLFVSTSFKRCQAFWGVGGE